MTTLESKIGYQNRQSLSIVSTTGNETRAEMDATFPNDVHLMVQGLRSKTRTASLHYLRMTLGVIMDPRRTIARSGIDGVNAGTVTADDASTSNNTSSDIVYLSHKELYTILSSLLEARADARTSSAVYARLVNMDVRLLLDWLQRDACPHRYFFIIDVLYIFLYLECLIAVL